MVRRLVDMMQLILYLGIPIYIVMVVFALCVKRPSAVYGPIGIACLLGLFLIVAGPLTLAGWIYEKFFNLKD